VKDEMGRLVTCMEKTRYVYTVLLKNPKGGDYMIDIVIYGRIILKLILWKWGFRNADWIHLCQARDWWQVFVNTVMNSQVQ
jgi:hypothetical protein